MKEKKQSFGSENDSSVSKVNGSSDSTKKEITNRAQDYVSGDPKWSSSSHQFGREPNRKE